MRNEKSEMRNERRIALDTISAGKRPHGLRLESLMWFRSISHFAFRVSHSDSPLTPAGN